MVQLKKFLSISVEAHLAFDRTEDVGHCQYSTIVTNVVEWAGAPFVAIIIMSLNLTIVILLYLWKKYFTVISSAWMQAGGRNILRQQNR